MEIRRAFNNNMFRHFAVLTFEQQNESDFSTGYGLIELTSDFIHAMENRMKVLKSVIRTCEEEGFPHAVEYKENRVRLLTDADRIQENPEIITTLENRTDNDGIAFFTYHDLPPVLQNLADTKNDNRQNNFTAQAIRIDIPENTQHWWNPGWIWYAYTGDQLKRIESGNVYLRDITDYLEIQNEVIRNMN
ncbi:Uncharacterized protein dnl_62600 [Desulfonema limicola]|uniref:Uncharacterized protein n=1 Tax=Desulfonema limicola TaxID=45656 RepID=A0A975BEE5_9BACT|nr:hypothetical protein [Desulfonema limicola]QTA83841.1 Uncharacterized protein dnl_62600 [Desulfonema limicola]